MYSVPRRFRAFYYVLGPDGLEPRNRKFTTAELSKRPSPEKVSELLRKYKKGPDPIVVYRVDRLRWYFYPSIRFFPCPDQTTVNAIH